MRFRCSLGNLARRGGIRFCTANLAGGWLSAVIEDTQIGVELNLMRNFGIYTGYRWWSYPELSSSESEWDLDLCGPTVGASLEF